MSAPVPLKKSRCQSVLVLVSHASALGVLGLTQLPETFAVMLVLLVSISLVVRLRRIAGKWEGLLIDALAYQEGRLTAYAAGQIVSSGLLLPGTVVTPFFCILAWHDSADEVRRHLFLCRSQFANEDYRQITVRLRWS